MASASVVTAFRARLATLYGGLIIGPNEAMSPPADGGRFVTFGLVAGDEEHIGLGAVGRRTFRERGAIVIVVLEPRMAGVDGALTVAEALRNGFRAWRSGNLVTGSPQPPTVDESPDRGAFVHVSFAVPYNLDIQA